ncbi:hypothetical protein [Maribacter huludaoensis]|uniref:hypothetical protein n=1 Tax=Maribacter huludaoensis TaxID=3030010 RepID=UPI0023EB5104|nr:hypothetical protein [Maribacter huludaoensis]MDF4222196.1 hypothetical protein [Maribacter huludaoensis]
MYLFYVYGAGFGHINRVLNYIYTQNIPLADCVLLTNSIYHDRVPKDIKTIHKEDAFFKDKEGFDLFLRNCITDYKIATLVVDVFPAGFYGELENSITELTTIQTVLLVRILHKDYFEKYERPVYDVIYSLEKGVMLANYNYKEVIPLTLQLKPRECSQEVTLKKPYFLVMHSSPIDEVLLLYRQALLYRTNEHIYIYSFSKIPEQQVFKNSSVIHSVGIADKHLKEASKIFTGSGFNSILETKKYREKQHVLPFKRKYDDQFLRKRLL